LWWSIPLAIGFSMFVRDTGLVWERTEKINANHGLLQDGVGSPQESAALNADGSVPPMSSAVVSGPAK